LPPPPSAPGCRTPARIFVTTIPLPTAYSRPTRRASLAYSGTHPRQDCRYGADAAAVSGILAKAGGGAKGFDYTKIANNGFALDPGATLGSGSNNWACTRDGVTGLTWEVKSALNADLRYSGHTYTWFNSNSSTNGGNSGSSGSTGTCIPVSSLCNTAVYIAALNAAHLCTYTDWRLPTRRELFTLVDFDGSSPAVEPTYFLNTTEGNFWTNSSSVQDPTAAWTIGFGDGVSLAGQQVVEILRAACSRRPILEPMTTSIGLTG